MRATVFHGPGDVRVEQVPDASIQSPRDAVVRVTHACVCGSDLWPYSGGLPKVAGTRIGHEFIGVVEAVGHAVRSVAVGDVVLSPFTWSDGVCDRCTRGLPSSCVRGGFFGGEGADGGQGEAVRVPQADGTLVRLPRDLVGDDRVRSVLPLTDVLPTGHHAARSAGVQRGSTVAVVGDGAVGLCGVLAAVRLGAERVIALGRHEARTALAERFGATDVVSARGQEAVEAVHELTGGAGVDSALECVGNQQSLDTALAVVRDGGGVGYVGVPAGVKGLNLGTIFRRNVTIAGGIAPARAYIPELLEDVLAGRLDAGPVLDRTFALDEVPEAYEAMQRRDVIKAMIVV
jgi:threonine dehydrogenase-like Zn-dependent dehydrogenase